MGPSEIIESWKSAVNTGFYPENNYEVSKLSIEDKVITVAPGETSATISKIITPALLLIAGAAMFACYKLYVNQAPKELLFSSIAVSLLFVVLSFTLGLLGLSKQVIDFNKSELRNEVFNKSLKQIPLEKVKLVKKYETVSQSVGLIKIKQPLCNVTYHFTGEGGKIIRMRTLKSHAEVDLIDQIIEVNNWKVETTTV